MWAFLQCEMYFIRQEVVDETHKKHKHIEFYVGCFHILHISKSSCLSIYHLGVHFIGNAE